MGQQQTPANIAQPESPPGEQPGEQAGEQRPITILHVDDDEANRYAVTRYLTKAGFQVSEAASGAEALAKVAQKPDLVILDVRLPDISGFEVCQRIKSNPHTSNTPVLHLSASYVTSEDKAHGLDVGADAYLIRPVAQVELLATVNALLRQRHTEERLKQANASLEQVNVSLEGVNDSLRVSEERYRSLVTASAAIVWCTNPAGEFIEPQSSWEAYTGQPWERHRGLGWLEAVYPADRQRLIADFNAARKAGAPFRSHGRMWHAASDGYHHFEVRGVPLSNRDGSLREWIGTVIDVEERQQLLERERAARREAEQANRLKDEFLATLSHELRTPLNAITGWASLLRGGHVTDEDLAEGLETIERNAKAQAQLIEDLLDVSRIISGKLRLDVQQVDLQAVCEAALASVDPAADAKGVRFVRALSSSGTTISGDPARLQQVVWNLLSNAVKFTPRDGRITIALARVASHVEIIVSDTGEGIDPEFLPCVFERFRQADSSSRRQKGGLGLGLAIVRHLIELHGGSVEAQSEGKGCGATFTVTLPVTAIQRHAPEAEGGDGDGEPHEPTRPPCEPMVKGLRALVVDDEEDSRRLLERILDECDMKVTVAASVAQAMQYLRGGHFDVVISDIGMPGEDGYDLIRQLRALPADAGGRTPAVALTAFARNEDRRRALLAGFQIHVPKPVDPAELLAVIAGTLGRAGVPSNS